MNISPETKSTFKKASDEYAKRKARARMIAGLLILSVSYGLLAVFITQIVIDAIVKK